MVSRSWLRFFGLLLGLLILGVFTGAVGCKSTSTATSPPPTPTSGVSFTKDIQPIFNANCVVCHQGAASPGGLSLEPNSAFKNLVNTMSTESILNLVTPSAPDKSYLLNKLLGTQSQVGGSGAQMPYNASPLPQAQINLIQQWISQGAPDN